MTEDQLKLILFELKKIEQNTRQTKENMDRIATSFEAEVAELRIPR
jgi:hypothetical protein